ncbi:putative ATP-dependent RNA helicase DHR1 [Exophiala dermatitidis]
MAPPVRRQRKQKARAREEKEKGQAASQQTNHEVIIPLSKAEREEKKRKLREELRAQQPKISSKKQKRLDKYIENKLKKDETLDLLKKLEKEKEKYDAAATATLQSTKNLGKRKFGDFVNGDGPGHAENMNARKGRQEDDDSDLESEDSFEAENPASFEPGEKEPVVKAPAPSTTPAAQGSGLAQPLVLDENGLPIIQSRKSKKRKKTTETQDPLELPWEGFDSEPSDLEEDSEDEAEDDEEEEDFESSGEDVSESDSSDSEGSDVESDVDSDEESDTSASEGADKDKIKLRRSAFKAWATQQLNQAVGHVPSYTAGEGQLPPKPTPRAPEPKLTPTDRPAASETPRESAPNRKAFAVHVDRPEEIQESRSALPILQREQEIMEAIYNNPVVVIKGDTGSGKTTQIPQFLFEAGYGYPDGPTPGLIGVTQPRRVAAVSMAKRVATELGQYGDRVSYQIRFDSTVSPSTAIKFMTDGILLRELSQDLLLRKYSAIVIDEAHERSVNTDILIGMLSKIVPARMQKSQFNPNPTPLKLIIMSATLNIGDFLHDKLFTPSMRPPIVEAEGRQHRVTTHFALRSRGDYVEEVIEKVRRAHRKLPRGGILVFLTGQNEIRQVASRLRELLAPRNKPDNKVAATPRVQIAVNEAPLEAEDWEIGELKVTDNGQDDFDIDILTHSEDEAEEAEFDISDDDDGNEEREDGSHMTTAQRATTSTQGKEKEPYTSVHILPLYSQLPTSEQLKVFEPPPPGSRLIVLATNVAETSLTIPGIRYVFDTGRSKERKYNLDTGVQSFEIDYISKASAQQRAGRAGRTGPGHCWRLYTSAVYEQYFPEHAEPEILRAPAESVVLQLKGFEYPRPVAQFPFPTPPAAVSLNKAEQLLKNLGALTTTGSITELGSQLASYPLSPRLGKILAAGINNPELIWQVLALVSGLAVSEIYISEAQLDLLHPEVSADAEKTQDEVYTRQHQQEDDERDRLRQEYGRVRTTLTRLDKTSDAMKLLTTVTMYLDATLKTNSEEDRRKFCREFFLRSKAMAEVSQLRGQLEALVRANHRATITSETLAKSRSLSLQVGSNKLPSNKIKQLNAIVASGYIDQVAIRYDRAPAAPADIVKPRRAIDVPYLPLVPLHDDPHAPTALKAVYIHPSSVLARLSVKEMPEYIVYSHLQRSQAHSVAESDAALGGRHATTATTTAATVKIPKTRMFPLTPLDGAQLAHLACDTALIEYGKPVPRSKVDEFPGSGSGSGSGSSPKRRECWVIPELRGGKSGVLGWPLPPVKVRQVLDVKSKSGWRVEKVLS